MNVATLTIEMAANIARLRADMDAAKSTVGGAMETIKGHAATAAKALGAIGVSLSVIGAGRALYNMTMDVAAAQSKLKELSEVTGATVEWLSAIRTTAKLAGTEMDAVAGGLTKLGKNIETGSEEAAKGLAAIGLNIEQLKGLKPDEQFDKVAKALNNFADGSGKTAAAQLILGKSGAQLLPFIKDYGELTEFNVKVTAQQAKEADDLEKNIKRLTAAKEAWKKVVGAELVPVLSDVVTVLLKMQTESNGTLSAAKKLSADGSIKEWAQNGALAVAFLVDAARAVPVVFRAVGMAIAAGAVEAVQFSKVTLNAAEAVARFSTDPVGAARALQAAREEFKLMGNATREAAADIDKLFSDYSAGSKRDALANQFRESAEMAKLAREHVRNFGDTAGTVRPQIKLLGGDIKDAKEHTNALGKALNDLFNRLNNKDDTAAKEMALLSKALQVGAISAVTYANGVAMLIKDSKALKDVRDDLVAQEAAFAAATEAAMKADDDRIAGMEAAVKDYRALIEQTELETRLLGLSNEERIIAAALLKAQAAGIDTTTEAWAKLAAQMRAAIYSKKEREDAIKANEELVAAQKAAWESLGNTVQGFFVDLFQNGRSAFGNLWQTVKRFFAQVAAQFATKFVLQTVLGVSGGASAGGGILGSLFSGGGLLGGVMDSIIGPGSAIGTALGMSSAMGPPAALAAGASPLSGLSSLLGPIGIIAGIGSLLYNLFGKDEKGIKFDNSVVGVGNPSSHWEQNAISQWDISGDLSRKDVAPFADRINKFDQWLADNLLTPQTLEAARQSLQAVKNPRWWNLEDKDAVEKASKYFLQERYSIIFGQIDDEVAGMIRTFQGSADELLAFIESAAQMVEPFKQLQELMPDLNLSLADFLDLTAEQRTAIVQLADTFPRLMVDSFDEVERIMKEAGYGTVEVFRAQADAMDKLTRDFLDGKVSLEQFAAAGANMATAYAQATAKIAEIQMTLDGLFADTRETYQLQGMTTKQQYDYFQAQAQLLYGQLGTASSPEQIESITRRILDYMNRANGLLTPEDRARLSGEYVDGLDRVQQLANERMQEATRTIGDLADKVYDSMTNAFDKWTQDQRDIADQERQTVDDFGDAVDRIPRTIDIRVDGAPVTGAPEVGG